MGDNKLFLVNLTIILPTFILIVCSQLYPDSPSLVKSYMCANKKKWYYYRIYVNIWLDNLQMIRFFCVWRWHRNKIHRNVNPINIRYAVFINDNRHSASFLALSNIFHSPSSVVPFSKMVAIRPRRAVAARTDGQKETFSDRILLVGVSGACTLITAE